MDEFENRISSDNGQQQAGDPLASFDYNSFLATEGDLDDLIQQLQLQPKSAFESNKLSAALDSTVLDATSALPSSGPCSLDIQGPLSPCSIRVYSQNEGIAMYQAPDSSAIDETDQTRRLREYQTSLLTNLNCRQRRNHPVSEQFQNNLYVNMEAQVQPGFAQSHPVVKNSGYPLDDTTQWINPKQFERLRKRREARHIHEQRRKLQRLSFSARALDVTRQEQAESCTGVQESKNMSYKGRQSMEHSGGIVEDDSDASWEKVERG